MGLTIPPSRPKLTKQEALDVLRKHDIRTDKPALLFVRGYYLNSMGKKGVNDVGVYDDAGFIVAPDFFASFNANTDPSKRGTGLAMVKTGAHRFYKGKHRGKYDALRYYPEGSRVPCLRDGRESTARYINIHRGGYSNTWSEGCITIPTVPMWTEFQKAVYTVMDRYGLTSIQLLLVDSTDLE